VVALVSLIVAGGWQLLINWDNPRVKQVREWLTSSFTPAEEPVKDKAEPQ